MKLKKFLFLIIILCVAIVAMSVCSLAFMVVKRPAVTEKEFHFSVTYKFKGETFTIKDVYTAYYVDNGSRTRDYDGRIAGLSRDNMTKYTLWEDSEECIALDTGLCPNCLMGDSNYECSSHRAMEPQLICDTADGMRYRDEETLLAQGVRLIDWDYPEPIENTLVFSHMTNLDCEVSPLLTLVGVLALLATVIFVKKEKGLFTKPIDHITILAHYLISLFGVPILGIAGAFADIGGGSDNIFHRAFYFAAAFAALGVAASVALRRKGYSKSACAVQFVPPVLIALLLIVTSVLRL